MGSQEIEPKQLTPQEDIEIFKQELEAENYEHALFHLACAIGTDPGNREWLFYADTVFDLLGSGVLEYLELAENVYFAIAALRAYYLWKIGEKEGAVALLSQVIAVVPDIPYLLWMERWIRDSEGIAQVPENTLYQMISRNIYQMDEYTAARGQELYHLLIDLFLGLGEPSGQSFMSKYMVLSMLYRRIGKMEEALAAAKEGYEKAPTAINATFVALCYKDMDDIAHMKEYTDLSLQLDPRSTAICNDMGDVLLGHGRFEEAASYYGIAMGDEEDDWAEPSYYYSRYRTGGKDADEMLGLLKEYRRSHPDSRRAVQLTEEAEDFLYPEKRRFYDSHPVLEEALANLLHNICESYHDKYGSPLHVLGEGEGGDMKVTLSCLESPSAVRALNLYLSDYDSRDCGVKLVCENCPEPSPLKPVQGSFRLWDVDEHYHFTSRVKQADPRVAGIVGELALTNYSLAGWYEKALELSGSLFPEDRASLYGTMVYPPRCPRDDYYMDWWLERIQFSAVFLLAALDEREGMILSPAACDICMGQIDWPLLPAMIVLTYQAIRHEEVRSTALVLFRTLMDRIYKKEFCFFTVTYLVCMLNMPGLEEKTKDTLRQWLRHELHRDEPDE